MKSAKKIVVAVAMMAAMVAVLCSCGGVIYDEKVCMAQVSEELDSRGEPLYYIDFTLADGVKSSALIIY